MIGTPEQRQAIIDYMIKKDRRTKLEIQNALRYNKAFKDLEKPKAEVGAIINDMIKDKILLKVGGVGASLYLGGMGSAQTVGKIINVKIIKSVKDKKMKKHFVHFLSPGTFVHEESIKEIDSWDIEEAKELARGIKERNGVMPFAFYFTTRELNEGDFDSKKTDESVRYYLGGVTESIEDVIRRNDPKESILLSNMISNGWNKIIINTNSWKVTQPLEENDVVLDFN